MIFFIAAALMVVLLAVIGNMMEQGMTASECGVHKWITNPSEKRTHYLVCKNCGREPT